MVAHDPCTVEEWVRIPYAPPSNTVLFLVKLQSLSALPTSAWETARVKEKDTVEPR